MPTKIVLYLVLLISATVFLTGEALGQEVKDEQTQTVPSEVRARMELYWTYYRQNDWGKLFEVADTYITDKQDYIYTRSREKDNPNRVFTSILSLSFEDKMLYIQSSKKWKIFGCASILGRDNQQRWVESASFVTQNDKKEWLVGGVGFVIGPTGSLIACARDLTLLSIKIDVLNTSH